MLLYGRTMEATDMYVRGVSGLRKVKEKQSCSLGCFGICCARKRGGDTIEAEH